MSSDNFVTSAKFLGYEMKWKISEPYSLKVGKYCKIFFTTVLNTLCKPSPMFRVAFRLGLAQDAPFALILYYVTKTIYLSLR